MSNDNPSPEKALIHVMVVMAAADRDMTDRELKRIVDQVRNLPVFADLDERDLIHSAEECAARLGQEGGLTGSWTWWPIRCRRTSWKPPMPWPVKSPRPTCASCRKRRGFCGCCATGSDWTA